MISIKNRKVMVLGSDTKIGNKIVEVLNELGAIIIQDQRCNYEQVDVVIYSKFEDTLDIKEDFEKNLCAYQKFIDSIDCFSAETKFIINIIGTKNDINNYYYSQASIEKTIPIVARKASSSKMYVNAIKIYPKVLESDNAYLRIAELNAFLSSEISGKPVGSIIEMKGGSKC